MDFVLLSRATDKDAASVSLEPLRRRVRSVCAFNVPDWLPSTAAQMPLPGLNTGWRDLFRMRSHEAPRISRAGLEAIANLFPSRSYETVFAGRLPVAVMLQELMRRGWVEAERKVADFDDIISRYRTREMEHLGRQGRVLARLDTHLLRKAEQDIATGWDAVSVCTADDVEYLKAISPRVRPYRVPNVMERTALPPIPQGAKPRVLFVGNLGFRANVQGLAMFLRECWPILLAGDPRIELDVVGLNPDDYVRQIVRQERVTLHADVPSVEPYYARSTVVIAPILIASGTRIKILEAMALGRPVVATSIAAEGLDLVCGRHLQLADNMPAFATAVLQLAADPARGNALASAARRFTDEHYSLSKLKDVVHQMVRPIPLAA